MEDFNFIIESCLCVGLNDSFVGHKKYSTILSMLI